MNHAMKVQQDFAKTVGVCYSGIVASDTLKASGAENEYVSRVLGHVARNTKSDQKLGRVQEILTAAPQTVTVVMSLLVLITGGSLVVGGALTAGMLVAFNQLLSAITAPVNKLLTFVNKIHTIKADMNRVDDIRKYELAPRYLKTEYATTDEKLAGDVKFVNVSFGYSPLAKPLIEDFNFHVQTGRSVALVGASGCGKSTITKILSGLYEPWGGEVLVDGVPLKDVSPDTVFSSIATVNQSITIFSGSIWDNLTLWNKSVMEQDVIRAAKDACLHDAISKLPGAYDYKLDENGQNLSGGQRQRLEIARALVTNPSILILDEATSALDPIVEKEVMDNIKRRGCTCVIVAHRLSTIRDCDEILVMERGHIVQRGTHEDLVKEDNLYHLLIQNS
jgi:ABC-type bacteriocin/lantibiotic exporter with double-glycine peptidase domain